jgi:hypothetical protein
MTPGKATKPSSTSSTADRFESFRAQISGALDATHIPGVFVPAGQPVPRLEVRIGRTHRLRGAKKITEGNFASNNWSGGVIQGNGNWTTAVGTWVIPTVSEPTEPQGEEGGWNSSSWVGIDGAFGSDDVLQAGIEQRVDGSGNTSYVAWYEWFCGMQKQTLSDTSPLSPSLASLNGDIFIAWKGDGNDNLNVMFSTNNGQTFGNKYTSGETSPQAPAICAHNGSIFIAWKGDGNDNLNVAQVNISGSSITGFSKTTLADTSPLSPSIVSLNGRLYIAWKGDGNDNLNVMYSADNGKTFGNKYTSGETSPQAPGLAVHNNNLYITWKGDGNDNLNVALVDISGNSITGFSQKITLGDTSPQSPCLASLNGRLYLAWKGDGNDYLNIMYSSDNGQTFGNKYTSPETSPRYPTLTTNDNDLFIGWKGDGNDNLNVSVVGLAGNAITGFTTPAYVWEVDINSFAVKPGDTVECKVQYVNNMAGQITLVDQTSAPNSPFSITLVPPPGASFSGNCAEWIMEAPDGGLPMSALPKFTPVRFTGAQCSTAAGQTGNPQTGNTFNIVNNSKTLTAVALASDAVSITFEG